MSDIAAFLAERIGLRDDGAGAARLERVVREGARRAGCTEAHYARLVAADAARAQELIDAVTVQESSFFRHPEQFDFLAEHLRGQAEPGVIWSAGCAEGQEPWSLAMLLEEQGLAGWTVLATDVSTRALERAEAGEFDERCLRGLDATRRGRFVTFEGRISARLRPRVRFARHNLAQDGLPAPFGECRTVLCRNVLIYLHRTAIAGLLERLRQRMPEGGVLLTGAGEALGTLPGFRSGPVPGLFLHAPTRRPPAPPAADEPTETPLPSVARLLTEASRLAADGQLEAAAERYRQAGFLEPADPRPRARLAALLEQIGRAP